MPTGRDWPLAIEVHQPDEALGGSSDDGQREREPEPAGAHHRLLRAADGDPDRERVLQRSWVDARIVERPDRRSSTR
jgi:hypothetical protein